jgi:hypothetical protein
VRGYDKLFSQVQEEGYHTTLSTEEINKQVIKMVTFGSLVYILGNDSLKISGMS